MHAVGANSRQPTLAGFLLLLASAVSTSTLHAQQLISARAGLITFTQGTVFLNGRMVPRNLNSSPRHQREMRSGQTLSTREGRAEILLGPDIYLRLDRASIVHLDDESLTDPILDLQQGVALIEVVEIPKDTHARIRIGNVTTFLESRGLYRFEAGTDLLGSGGRRLLVYGGEAGVAFGPPSSLSEGSALGTAPTFGSFKLIEVTKGKRLDLLTADTTPSSISFDRAQKRTDPLHAWSAQRSLTLFTGIDGKGHRHWVSTIRGTMWNDSFGIELRSRLARAPSLPPSLLGGGN